MFAFGQFPLVVVSWICMFVSALVVPFVLLRWWAAAYSSSNHPTFYTLLAATLLLLYQSLGLGFLPAYIVLRNSLPPASCFILILEQVLNWESCCSAVSDRIPGAATESSLTSCFLFVVNLTLPLYTKFTTFLYCTSRSVFFYWVLKSLCDWSGCFVSQVRLMMKVHSFIRENVSKLWSPGKYCTGEDWI